MLSVISTPTFDSGEPSGPITYGITYIVRPRIEPVEPSAQLGVGLGGLHPVVGRAGVVLCRRADEGELLGARDVVGIRAMQVAAGALLLVERDQDALGDRLLGEPVLLGFRTVAPDDAIRLGQRGDFRDPIAQRAAFGRASLRCVGIGVTSCAPRRSSVKHKFRAAASAKRKLHAHENVICTLAN